jgi:F-box protein 9
MHDNIITLDGLSLENDGCEEKQAVLVENRSTDVVEKSKNNHETDDDDNDDDDDASTAYTKVWFREEEQWELTWPIWHMLPREERRSLARQHGYNKIGEFEEYMILQQAVGDSSSSSSASASVTAYENKYAYSPELRDATTIEKKESAQRESDVTKKLKGKIKSSTVDANSDDDDDEDSVEIEPDVANTENRNDPLTLDIMMENGGKILMLPDDMLHRIFDWLFVDTYATLALVSPHWKTFTRTEATYKRLCERLYLNQSLKRQLHVSRFNNSYRTMLEKRPRLRAGNGVYILKYSRIRKIQRDMFTEIPAGAVLEMVYYRYLYFEENGRVLYALTPSPPHEMFPRLKRVCLTGQTDRSAVWGTYTVQKTCVKVHAKQAWHHVQLTMSIDLDNRSHGRYGCLIFDQHLTSVTGNFDDDDWLSDRITYDVPEEPFRFIKDRRL